MMKPHCLLLLTLLGCAPAGAPERAEAPRDSAGGEVAFALGGRDGAALVVPVHVNGRGPFDFVLDTGATLTCVDAALIRRLDLPAQEGVLGLGATTGGTGALQLIRIDSLRVGGATAGGLDACALDLSHMEQIGLSADGLLGLNFLRAFRVTLDFEREVMHLEPAE